MANLIKNSNWQQIGVDGGPKYFKGTGPTTFDNSCYMGNRTCSLTMASGTASDSYTCAIDVTGRCTIRFGYTLRAVEAENIALAAEFLDCDGEIIKSVKVRIENLVSCNFKRITECYRVPRCATVVRFSLLFSGRVTACTFCAPCAY